MSLAKATLMGVKWTAAKTGISFVLSFIFQILKARLLIPEEFAQIAVIMISVNLIKSFEGVGLIQGLIQKKTISEKEKNSVFAVTVLFSFLATTLLLIAAHPISLFFNMPEVKTPLQIASLSVLLFGPSQFFRTLLIKQMLFKPFAIIGVLEKLTFTIIAILLIFKGFGVLGFIIGFVFSIALSSVLIFGYYFTGNTLNLKILPSFSALRPFLKFGVFGYGRSIWGSVVRKIDEIIIGVFFTPDVLGVYYFGKSFIENIRGNLSAAYSKVLFPMFSKINNCNKKLIEAERLISRYTAIIVFPLFTGLAIVSPQLIPTVFGSQWIDSVIVVQVFSFAMILKMIIINLSGNLLYAANRPDKVFYAEFFSDIFYVILLLIISRLGLYAIIIAYFSSVTIKSFALQRSSIILTSNSWLKYLSTFKKVTLVTFIMLGLVKVVQLYIFSEMEPIFNLIGSIGVGVISYIGLTLYLDRSSVIYFSALIKKHFHK